MSTGVVLPFESAAMRGDEMPSGLPAPDQWLFIALRSLYWEVKKGIIGRDQAVIEKRKLLDEYRLQRFNADLWSMARERECQLEQAITDVLTDKELMQNSKICALISAIDGINRKEQENQQ